MKQRILTVFFLVCPFLFFSQSYDASAGLRIGTEWGLTGKGRVANRTTVEGLLQKSLLNQQQTVLTGLVEFHEPFISKRFNFYKGVGLHKGWIPKKEKYKALKNSFGISGVAGIEMTMVRYNISYDIKPALNLTGGHKIVDFQTGFSIRYVVDKRKVRIFKKKKKKRGSEPEKSKAGQVIDNIFKRNN